MKRRTGGRRCRLGFWSGLPLGLGMLAGGWGLSGPALAGDPPAPPTIQLTVTNGLKRIDLPRYPGVEAFTVQSTTNLSTGFADDTQGQVNGYEWTAAAEMASRFYRLKIATLSSNALLTSIAFNRLAYGPTPDELERVLTGPKAIGPEAYLAEQLAPEAIDEQLDTGVSPTSGWQYVTMTGPATSSGLWLMLASAGEAYIADVSLVAGSTANAGQNLVLDGDFSMDLTNAWTLGTNMTGSAISTDVQHAGHHSLHLVATSAGTSRDSSVWQIISPALTVGKTYTLSFWYLPSAYGSAITVQLAGATTGSGLLASRSQAPVPLLPGLLYGKLTNGVANLSDMRAWHILHALRSRRQLLEVLVQFFDNHFTTEYTKSRNFLDGPITNQNEMTWAATDFEFRKLVKWRQILLNPNGTFGDLLKVCAENPAMVIYLDTVTSTGGNPNENFSREIMELFTMGVDNGYDQTDIEQMSRAWTGWRVDKLPLGQETNVFASAVTNRNSVPGYWTLRFDATKHDAKAKVIWQGQTVDARFGPRFAGRPYELDLPARSGNAGMQDGYDIVQQLANLPYTQEFISVKLCRLLVHESFYHGVYDYSNAANLTPESKLVYDCMVAWDTPAADGRKGNLRQVLAVILNSDLFRSQAAAQQKVKTPFRYLVSVVRSLRALRPDGTYTADTDGYGLLTNLIRENMALFDRVDPDGYSEYGRDWVSTSALMDRLRFSEDLLIASRDSLKTRDLGSANTKNVSDPVALLQLKVPSTDWRDPTAVVDYFLGVLIPGDGKANLALDRANAIAYLNADDKGNSSPFSNLVPGTTAYDARVRSLVGLLLASPRFQEE